MDPAELRPLRVGEILDVAIKIYRSNFATLVKAVALLVAPVQVLVAIVQASAPDTPIVSTTPGATPEFDFDQFWGLVAALVVVSILGVLATQVATAASLKAVSGAYVGEEPGWRESLRFAFARLGSLVWLGLLTNFLLTLAFLACVVPSIYLYTAWAVAVPVLLLEDVRGRKALGRSRFLVRDRWWPTFAVILVGALMVFVVQLVLAGVLGAIVGFAVFFGDDSGGVAGIVVQAVVGTVSGVLTTPFTAALVAVVYFDLRVRKEGFDLELLARRVGMGPPAGRGPASPPPPGPSWSPQPPPGPAPLPTGWGPTADRPAQPPESPSDPPPADDSPGR